MSRKTAAAVPDSLVEKALAAQRRGDSAAAVRLCRQALERAPQHAGAQRLLGQALQEQGLLAEALPYLQQAAGAPGAAAEKNNLAVALRQLGRLGEAIAWHQAAVNEQPQDPLLLGNLAGAFYAAGALVQAAETYVAALALDGANAPLLNNFALTLQALGQLDDAAACFDAAIAADAGYAPPHDNLGTLLTLRGRPAEAVARHAAAVKLNPLHANGWNNLGNALAASGRKPQAPPCWRRALAVNPLLAEGWTNLGVGLRDQEQFPEAARALARALRLDPTVAAAWNNRGDALYLTAGDAVALAHYRRAVALEPGYGEAWSNIALATQRGGALPAAGRLFDRALTINPDLAGARFNRGLLRLEAGDLTAGWPDYAWRFASGKVGRGRTPALPAWRGEALGPGQKLLVWREQGLGDEILFASLYADLLARGVTAVFECDRRLLGLLGRALPAGTQLRAETVDARGRETLSPPDCARHAPAGSLARLLRRQLTEFSPRDHWLAADPDQIAFWRGRLDDASAAATGGRRLRVGVAWRSQLMTADRRAAYLQLADFAPLFAVPGVDWVNVQYGPVEDELRAAEAACGVTLRRWDDLDLKDDLEGLAALLVNLDLVIAPAVSVGEMAAALGVPAWRLGGRDWTWLGTGARPWFPAMQALAPRPGEDTPAVMARVARRLTRLAPPAPPVIAADDPRPLVNAATKDLQAGRHDAARRRAQAALSLAPALAEAMTGLGAAQRAGGDHDRAALWQSRALTVAPGHPAALINLGRARAAAGAWDGAERALRIACAAAPERAAAWANLCHVRRFAGAPAAAERAADRALVINPAERTARANRGLLRLARGDLAAGWDDYAARLTGGAAPVDLAAVAGKVVEVRGEQGLGDEILFASCLPDLLVLAGRVRLTCDRRLVGLFARSFPQLDVRPTGTPEPESADTVIWAGDLPRLFRRRPGDFPMSSAAAPLLTADPARAARWRRALAAAGAGLKLGIAWTSGLVTAERAACRTRLADWRPLAQVPGVTLVSLQYGDVEDEIAAAEAAWGVSIRRWPGLDLRDDLEETAALAAALDLAVTIPSAAGELAAALGTPTWRLTPPGDWTLLGGGARPWFPAQRVIVPSPGCGLHQAVVRAARILIAD